MKTRDVGPGHGTEDQRTLKLAACIFTYQFTMKLWAITAIHEKMPMCIGTKTCQFSDPLHLKKLCLLAEPARRQASVNLYHLNQSSNQLINQ